MVWLAGRGAIGSSFLDVGRLVGAFRVQKRICPVPTSEAAVVLHPHLALDG